MPDHTLDEIKTMVQKDYSISQQLLKLLSDEQLLIKQRNFDALKDILISKVPLIDQLNHHAQLRETWLSSLNLIVNEHSWSDYLSSFNTPAVNQQWYEVNRNIHDCKRVNEENGLLIGRGQKTCAQLLQLLKGNTQKTELYTAKGCQQSIRTYSSVTKA